MMLVVTVAMVRAGEGGQQNALNKTVLAGWRLQAF